MNNHNIEAFYAFLRAELWEDHDVNLNLDLNEKVDWEDVYQLARV